MSDPRPVGDLKELHPLPDDPEVVEPSAGLPGEHGSAETPEVPEKISSHTVPDGNVPGTSGEPGKGIVEDPVEILVRMAERGEIDPWNIDIIEVTDKFLTELDRCRQLNLQLSGRTLFFAATLLRMKSEHLELLDVTDEDGGGEEGDSFGDEFGSALDSEAEYSGRLGPIERLEHEIQRRLDRKNMRKSPVTLFELILELKNIEKEERRRRRMNTPSTDDSLFNADDVVGIAHDEGYQESSMTTLMEYLEGIEVDGEMTLAELCTTLGWGIPEVYIPLLFLALDGRCSLRQEEFFGDIYVQICKVDAESSLPEVPAE
jgi:segregation and condensation protein A